MYLLKIKLPVKSKDYHSNATNLSEEEVERMKSEAEAHAKEDQEKRQFLKLKNA